MREVEDEWISAGEAAGLAVERLRALRNKRAACGRQLTDWPRDGNQSGGEIGGGFVRRTARSEIVVALAALADRG